MNKLASISFTKEGYENLKKEYENIFNARPDAVKTLSKAREMGDLSENGFYKAAKARLSSIDSNLRRLKILIKNAKVADKPHKEGIVGFGNKVTVNDGKINREFNIVGRYESNPAKDKISDVSPIGRALIGKKVEDVVKVNTPKGEIIYKIIKVK